MGAGGGGGGLGFELLDPQPASKRHTAVATAAEMPCNRLALLSLSDGMEPSQGMARVYQRRYFPVIASTTRRGVSLIKGVPPIVEGSGPHRGVCFSEL